MNFYKHHLGDYDGATAHLSWEEDLAYTRLLRAYYRREKPIPLNPGETFRLVRANTACQKKAVSTVLNEFFVELEDGWHNKRADEEIAAYQAQADTNRRIARERTVQRIVHQEPETKRPPNQEPLTKNQEPRTSKPTKALAFAPPEWVPLDPWNAWLDVRKKKRAPNTERALELAVEKLEELRGSGQDPKAILEQSVFRGWQGLFEVKGVGAAPDYSALQRQIEEEEKANARH